MITKTIKYKNLYSHLMSMNYTLNNQIENALFKDDVNYELYEALTEFAYNSNMNEELKYLDYYNIDNQSEWDKVSKEHGEVKLKDAINKDLISEELREEIENNIQDYGIEGCEIYQSFIVDEFTKEILEDYGQFVYYIEEANLYIWGVMHYGTSWSMIMDKNYPIQNKERYILNDNK